MQGLPVFPYLNSKFFLQRGGALKGRQPKCCFLHWKWTKNSSKQLLYLCTFFFTQGFLVDRKWREKMSYLLATVLAAVGFCSSLLGNVELVNALSRNWLDKDWSSTLWFVTADVWFNFTGLEMTWFKRWLVCKVKSSTIFKTIFSSISFSFCLSASKLSVSYSYLELLGSALLAQVQVLSP